MVATTPIVVFCPAARAPQRARPHQRPGIRKPRPSGVRTPATTCPVAGSITSPTALTATSAATIRPSGSVIDAVPMPPFIARAGPASFPTVAPAPAPTLPSATGPADAAAAAR